MFLFWMVFGSCANGIQMMDLKENIEAEVQSAREEYMKMESHIRLYITEMEQSI